MLTFLSFLSVCVAADRDAVEKLFSRVRDVFDQSKNSVVRVVSTDSYGKLCGTGFFADPSGTVYTLTATVAGATEVTVHHGDKAYPAKVLVADPRSGIAILKVDALTSFLSTTPASSLKLSDPILAVGYPMDLSASPNFGTVASFDHKERDHYFTTTHVRANLPVQNGQGGAPVLNMDGKVVGIVVSCLSDGAGCYILPIEAVEKIRGDYMRFGGIKHGWIGVNVEDAPKPVHGSTARVAQLDMASPANGSGLQVGDIILRIGKAKVTRGEDILDASFFLTAGDVTPITYVRNGKEQMAHVEPTLHPIAKRMEEKAKAHSLVGTTLAPAPTPQ